MAKRQDELTHRDLPSPRMNEEATVQWLSEVESAAVLLPAFHTLTDMEKVWVARHARAELLGELLIRTCMQEETLMHNLLHNPNLGPEQKGSVRWNILDQLKHGSPPWNSLIKLYSLPLDWLPPIETEIREKFQKLSQDSHRALSADDINTVTTLFSFPQSASITEEELLDFIHLLKRQPGFQTIKSTPNVLREIIQHPNCGPRLQGVIAREFSPNASIIHTLLRFTRAGESVSIRHTLLSTKEPTPEVAVLLAPFLTPTEAQLTVSYLSTSEMHAPLLAFLEKYEDRSRLKIPQSTVSALLATENRSLRLDAQSVMASHEVVPEVLEKERKGRTL